jgi:membrane fusion protein (multidrug efflux system)
VLPQLAIGQEAAFGLAEGDMRFSGKVTGIEPKVDPSSRLVSVQAELANPDGLLRPGQFIRVRVLLPAEDGVVAVPQTAVILSLYGSYVYRIEPAEDAPETLVARQVFVETGRRSGTEIEIRSGLEAGAQIAVAGQNKLSNGSPVAIDNSVVPGDATAAAGGQP